MSNTKIIKQLRDDIAFRDKYRKKSLAKWEKALPDSAPARKRYFRQLLKREGITARQARAQWGLPQHVPRRLAARDAYDQWLIALAEKAGVSLNDWERTLIEPGSLQDAWKKLANESAQDAALRSQLKTLNLKPGSGKNVAEKLRRQKALQQIHRLPSRRKRMHEAKAIGLEIGETFIASQPGSLLRQPFVTSMIVYAARVLEHSTLPKSEHSRCIARGINFFWSTFSPNGKQLGLTPRAVRERLRKASRRSPRRKA